MQYKSLETKEFTRLIPETWAERKLLVDFLSAQLTPTVAHIKEATEENPCCPVFWHINTIDASVAGEWGFDNDGWILGFATIDYHQESNGFMGDPEFDRNVRQTLLLDNEIVQMRYSVVVRQYPDALEAVWEITEPTAWILSGTAWGRAGDRPGFHAPKGWQKAPLNEVQKFLANLQ